MIYKEIIIIGAGPAGLMAANMMKKEYIILEKNLEVGKKLLISGSGQCNFTNICSLIEFSEKFGDKKRFVQFGLSKFNNNDSINFFKNKNLSSYIREDGKVFPITMDSNDILKTLLIDIKDEIMYNCEVLSINKKDKFYFVKTNNQLYKSKYVIVATGGRTYPKTGSTGDGYKFAADFNINMVKLRNGLCGINIYEDFSDISGVSFQNIKVDLYRDNRKNMEFYGDLLFTHSGISGPIIINNARYIREEDILKMNFLNQKSEEFEKKLIDKMHKHPKKSIINILKEFDIPDRVLIKLVNNIGLNVNGAELSKKNRKLIVSSLTEKCFTVKKVGTLHNSMVTVGGIDLSEINKKSMESKDNKNLFFIGEVLDIDGDTGGYNIQWAFTSAKLASLKINEKD
jgi:predicted Rossmann fold flavoprotein